MRRWNGLSLFGFTLATLAALSAAMADTIKLANGREMQGVVEEQDDQQVKIRTRGGTVTFPRGEVVSIKKATAPAAGTSPLPKWDARSCSRRPQRHGRRASAKSRRP